MTTTTSQLSDSAPPIQRIVKLRRDYNTWVANETLEDYALRFTARSFRRWSEFRVANTAFGAISFLLLEAVGGSLLVNYGFVNAFWAVMFASAVIFLTSLPISYYGAKYGVDMDLLTRGAGFGYIGSTITSLIYASFTFIFFALEATIMAVALKLCTGLPLVLGYLISALAVIPLVTHGITLISRLQAWTQPVWLILLALPYIFVIAKSPHSLRELPSFAGHSGGGFNLLMFGAASSVVMSMVTQVGEQIDFLRFLPERRPENRRRWLFGMLFAGPGWIVLGAVRMLAGAYLAFVAIRQAVPPDQALEPAQMYWVGFQYVFDSPAVALVAMTVFVVLSQIKINVTNAYAGSLAWSNFFARITHSHPGRVVWVVFNVVIALVLMQLDVFHALERVLGLYSNVAISWVGALVADLVVNKPLGLSPKGIEFKRAHLYDINPVGVGAMLIASALSIAAFSGLLGEVAQAFSSFIALATAFVMAPLIAWITGGRYYIARQSEDASAERKRDRRCCICKKRYEHEDMALCPAYRGPICSLCCSLDARCHDACKPGASLANQFTAVLRRLLPSPLATLVNTRLGQYLLVLAFTAALLGIGLSLIYVQEFLAPSPETRTVVAATLRPAFFKVFVLLFLASGVGCWWLVLAAESRRVAQEESNRQTHLLMREIDAHRKTDAKLQSAKLAAERANQAKSRYVTGISHELRTPLNSILGYAQILEGDPATPARHRDPLAVIRRSGEHLVSLIDGLLDIAKIESGKLTLETEELRFPEFLTQLAGMFRLQAELKGIEFFYTTQGRLPAVIRADKKRLGQILINILGNAVKFTARGSVRFLVRYRNNTSVFEVHDTGPGIGAPDLQRIFLPFERGGHAGSGSESGTGLGLTIAKMLATLMGGELSVRSSPGEGSVFEVRVFLPEIHNPKPQSVVPVLDVVDYAGPRRRVLVVDDEAVDRQFLANVLQPLGFELVEAASGIEALSLALQCQPDLVLLDIGMPGIDGWETARLLRASVAPHLPILVISADVFDGNQGQSAGIVPKDFLIKPVSVPVVLDRIRDLLGLVWITRGTEGCAMTTIAEPGSDPPAQRNAGADGKHVMPPATDLRALRDLGELGHVRGILAKLDDIERRDARLGPFIQRLRRLVKSFRLSDYMHVLEQVSHDSASPL
jgi:signal transduction histidine kinase/CheY-like chemotaxis protein/purine-cytosine permease-like protein